MALPLVVLSTCTSIGAAVSDTASPSYNGGYETVTLEPTTATGSIVNGAAATFCITTLAKQGLFVVGTAYTITITAT